MKREMKLSNMRSYIVKTYMINQWSPSSKFDFKIHPDNPYSETSLDVPFLLEIAQTVGRPAFRDEKTKIIKENRAYL